MRQKNKVTLKYFRTLQKTNFMLNTPFIFLTTESTMKFGK